MGRFMRFMLVTRGNRRSEGETTGSEILAHPGIKSSRALSFTRPFSQKSSFYSIIFSPFRPGNHDQSRSQAMFSPKSPPRIPLINIARLLSLTCHAMGRSSLVVPRTNYTAWSDSSIVSREIIIHATATFPSQREIMKNELRGFSWSEKMEKSSTLPSALQQQFVSH